MRSTKRKKPVLRVSANKRAKLAVDRSLASARKQSEVSTNIWKTFGSSGENENASADQSKAENSRKSARLIAQSKPLQKPSLGRYWTSHKPKVTKLAKGYVFSEKDASEDENSTYNCEICNTDFLFEAQYLSHKINCSLKTTVVPFAIVYECTSCGKSFNFMSDYLNHYSKSNESCVDTSSKIRLGSSDICLCFLCGFATKRSMLTDHLRIQHKEETRRPNDNSYYKDCELCYSQYSTLAAKSAMYLSPLEFFSHLSLRHPAAVVLKKCERLMDASTENVSDDEVENDKTDFVDDRTTTTCHVCNADILKSQFENHMTACHFVQPKGADCPVTKKPPLFDPVLRKRKRFGSPPPPLLSVYYNADTELSAKHHRKRCYKYTKVDSNICRGCGWQANNRDEYFIHVLCGLCRPSSAEFNMRMKCPLCFVVAKRSEILTHLCKLHEQEISLQFDKFLMATGYQNEGMLAKEIIGYEWYCTDCLAGFYKRTSLHTHKCSSVNKEKLSPKNDEKFSICAICRVYLKNDLLLQLHHRFEHEDARSGLDEPCDDPALVYTAVQSQADAVENYTDSLTKYFRKSNEGIPCNEGILLCSCVCGARFYSQDVFRIHKDIFHSKSFKLPDKMVQIMTNLYADKNPILPKKQRAEVKNATSEFTTDGPAVVSVDFSKHSDVYNWVRHQAEVTKRFLVGNSLTNSQFENKDVIYYSESPKYDKSFFGAPVKQNSFSEVAAVKNSISLMATADSSVTVGLPKVATSIASSSQPCNAMPTVIPGPDYTFSKPTSYIGSNVGRYETVKNMPSGYDTYTDIIGDNFTRSSVYPKKKNTSTPVLVRSFSLAKKPEHTVFVCPSENVTVTTVTESERIDNEFVASEKEMNKTSLNTQNVAIPGQEMSVPKISKTFGSVSPNVGKLHNSIMNRSGFMKLPGLSPIASVGSQIFSGSVVPVSKSITLSNDSYQATANFQELEQTSSGVQNSTNVQKFTRSVSPAGIITFSTLKPVASACSSETVVKLPTASCSQHQIFQLKPSPVKNSSPKTDYVGLMLKQQTGQPRLVSSYLPRIYSTASLSNITVVPNSSGRYIIRTPQNCISVVKTGKQIYTTSTPVLVQPKITVSTILGSPIPTIADSTKTFEHQY